MKTSTPEDIKMAVMDVASLFRERVNWVQGSWHIGLGDGQSRYCLGGAILHVAGAWELHEDMRHELQKAFIAAIMTTDPQCKPLNMHMDYIIRWNDAPSRTFGEVLHVIEIALGEKAQ